MDPIFFINPQGKYCKARVFEVRSGDHDVPRYNVILAPRGGVIWAVEQEQLTRRIEQSRIASLYWDSMETHKLFCPKTTETVLDAVDAQIAIIQKCIRMQDGWKYLVDGGPTYEHLFNKEEKQTIIKKAMYVVTALQKVETSMLSNTWGGCVSKAIRQFASSIEKLPMEKQASIPGKHCYKRNHMVFFANEDPKGDQESPRFCFLE